MKTYHLVVMLLVASVGQAHGQGAKKQPAKSDQELFQGAWAVVKLESNGKENKVLPDSKLVVEKDMATLFEGKMEAVTFRFKLAPGRDPKAIDLTAVRNGKDLDTLPGIYEVSENSLKICFNFDKVRPQTFAAPADANQEVMTLRRGEPAKTAWKDFEAKEGFIVALPGKPEEKELGGLTTLGNVAGKQYKYRHETLRISFMAQALDYAADAKLPAIDKHLQIERDAFIQGLMGGKLIDEKKIKLGEQPGLELNAEFLEGKGGMRTRMFIVGRRVYMVSVVGVKEDVSSRDADGFIESFKLK